MGHLKGLRSNQRRVCHALTGTLGLGVFTHLPFIKDLLAGRGTVCEGWALFRVRLMMPVESVQSLIALVLGFCVAGMCASGYQLFTDRLPSFGLLQDGARPAAVAAVPLLVFAAP